MTPTELAEYRRLKDQVAQLEERQRTEDRTGPMREVHSRDAADRKITRYVGDEGSCWNQFNPPVRYVRRLLVPSR